MNGSASRGLMVIRPGVNDGNSPTRASALAKKPSIRKTIESMTSTGSQADFARPDQTIIIFDWDDTLCPSSWIRANRSELSFFRPAPKIEKFQRPLRTLQKHVEALLTFAMTLGFVVIVTNAMDPWVETSCRNFLPQLLPMVMRLPVIYARSIFELQNCDPLQQQQRSSSVPRPKSLANSRSSASKALPGLYSANGQNRLSNYNSQLVAQRRLPTAQVEMDPQRWKEVAFEQEISGFYSRYAHQSWKNVISIGDSIFERDALRRVMVNRKAQSTKRCRTKTLKLFDDPNADELIEQVRVVHEVLGMMVQYDGELDIEIDEEDLKVDMPLADKLRD
jgi:hypothetical protein